ncbi:MAG: cation:proton antiporter [Bacteroidales bacterium]|nr:cation:proton antiporter [Bacteroidales bacterium]MBN2820788.1 cation:proton antiporter [Bacteroidales bacterium]
MNLYITIISLGVLIFLSHVFNELFDKTKIPNVLLLLLIGIIIGPVSGIVTTDFFGKLGNVFTTITLIVILFESGSGLNFKEIKKAIGSATLLTLLNFIITVLLTSYLSRWLLSIDVMSSVFIGSIVGGTSSAVVIPMVKQLKMGEKSTSVLILESALSDVLCLVVGLALLDGITQGVVTVGMVLSKMWKAFVFAITLGLLSGFVWSAVIGKIRSVKNSMFTTLAFVFILYGVVELLGLNGGIAVLSFGILLGNVEGFGKTRKFKKLFAFESSGFNPHERDFFSEVVFIMQTYFFVYVGISIQFGSISIYAAGLLIVLLIILLRVPGVIFLTGSGITRPEKTIMSVMTPKGLVPAVLASLPLQRGLAHGEIILDLGYSIVLFSIIICSLLVILLSVKPNLFGNIFKLSKDNKTEISLTNSDEIKAD